MDTYSYEELKDLMAMLDNYGIPYELKDHIDEEFKIDGHFLTVGNVTLTTWDIDEVDEEYNRLPLEGEE